MKKAIITALLAIALPLVSQAQKQTFNLPAFFATNVYLYDNTNLPLHLRISGSAVSNVQDWATLAAVTNINVNQFDLDNVGGIDFDTTPAGTIAAARMQWNPDFETVRLGLDAAVSLDIGQQHVAFVRNAESVTISNGTVVYISGASGDKAEVKIASYSNDTLSARTIGIAAENITAGNTGFVVTRGPVYAQDTSAFAAGAMLYLGAYGNITTNRPSAPLHGVFVGVVEKVNANAGVIYVAVQNGFELDELHDVNVAANTTNHLIISQGAVWTNMAIGSGLGVTNNQLVVTNVAGTFESLTGSRFSLGNASVTNIATNAIGAFVAAQVDGTNSIGAFAYGASQQGRISGTASIDAFAYGASQQGRISGTASIGISAYGASQQGWINGTASIGDTAYGASQQGLISGTASIGDDAYGASQQGFLQSSSTATNNAIGAIQIMGAATGEVYTTTSTGYGSLLLGPGTQTNAYGILANGPIQTLSGFVGNAANLTNFPSSILTVSAGNANYWRITTAPTGATSSGSSGQLAVSGTNIYIYSPNALGVGTARWLRVTGDAAW